MLLIDNDETPSQDLRGGRAPVGQMDGTGVSELQKDAAQLPPSWTARSNFECLMTVAITLWVNQSQGIWKVKIPGSQGLNWVTGVVPHPIRRTVGDHRIIAAEMRAAVMPFLRKYNPDLE